ncbi:MAG: GIY-YIG nuclease family protein [Alphaproteobacteria bacterium]|nr:GIY-YIG nuclease family protein [Alphaproteobacteria bacterium]MBV9694768.1 GIY-YIG nuclease family protein [Alphaproteobacteria bacterium]
MNKRFFVYIMASKPWGPLYTGVTRDLEVRVYQHKHGLLDGFAKKHGVKVLVHFEEHGTAADAIQREKRIKKWPRAWKINLIRTDNPDWFDLAKDWYPEMPTAEEIENWVARMKRAMTVEDVAGEEESFP